MALKEQLPGVPPLELPLSPTDAGIPADDVLATEVFLSLRDKGYAVIDFPCDDFEALVGQVQRDLGERYDWQAWRQTGYHQRDGLRLQDAWQYSEAVRAIAAEPRMLKLLETLYGRRVFPFQTLNFPVGTQQPAHSDHVHFATVPERWMVGVWVALEDVHDDAGPLLYYEGSHRLPFFWPEQLGQAMSYPRYLALWEQLCEHHRFEQRRFLARKGQALIWAANLIHGGSPQLDSTRTRWSQVTHYFFERCIYYTPINSSVYSGRMHVRAPINIITGEPEVGELFGRPLDPAQRLHLSSGMLPPNFDPARYLRANPDVAAAKVDPAMHYLLHGIHEGRSLG